MHYELNSRKTNKLRLKPDRQIHQEVSSLMNILNQDD
jgi:hypothetical protein